MTSTQRRTKLAFIEDPKKNNVTFTRRRVGLVKKAHELAHLCGSDVMLVMFDNKGHCHYYSSHPDVWQLAKRFTDRAVPPIKTPKQFHLINEVVHPGSKQGPCCLPVYQYTMHKIPGRENDPSRVDVRRTRHLFPVPAGRYSDDYLQSIASGKEQVEEEPETNLNILDGDSDGEGEGDSAHMNKRRRSVTIVEPIHYGEPRTKLENEEYLAARSARSSTDWSSIASQPMSRSLSPETKSLKSSPEMERTGIILNEQLTLSPNNIASKHEKKQRVRAPPQIRQYSWNNPVRTAILPVTPSQITAANTVYNMQMPSPNTTTLPTNVPWNSAASVAAPMPTTPGQPMKWLAQVALHESNSIPDVPTNAPSPNGKKETKPNRGGTKSPPTFKLQANIESPEQMVKRADAMREVRSRMQQRTKARANNLSVSSSEDTEDAASVLQSMALSHLKENK